MLSEKVPSVDLPLVAPHPVQSQIQFLPCLATSSWQPAAQITNPGRPETHLQRSHHRRGPVGGGENGD